MPADAGLSGKAEGGIHRDHTSFPVVVASIVHIGGSA